MKDQSIQGLLPWKTIYWIGNTTQLNDIGFVNNITWNHKAKGTTTNQIHFLNKIVILLGQQMNKIVYFIYFFYE